MNSKKLSEEQKKEPIKTQSNNGGLRGFGLRYDCKTGRTRNWYYDKNGVQRWADNDKEVMA